MNLWGKTSICRVFFWEFSPNTHVLSCFTRSLECVHLFRDPMDLPLKNPSDPCNSPRSQGQSPGWLKVWGSQPKAACMKATKQQDACGGWNQSMFTYLDLPRGAEWMIRGACTPSLGVQTAPFGRCWYIFFVVFFVKYQSSANGELLVWFGIPEKNEKGCYLGVSRFESQTTN